MDAFNLDEKIELLSQKNHKIDLLLNEKIVMFFPRSGNFAELNFMITFIK